MPNRRTPVVVLASIDPVQREIALASALMDSPDMVALVHDIDWPGSRLRRRVLWGAEVLEDSFVQLDHLCPSCAVREDAVPVIARLLDARAWSGVLVALPISAELGPASEGLAIYTGAGDVLSEARLSATVALVDTSKMVADLLGEDEVGDRGVALAEYDDRSVGEALLGQLTVADAVLTLGEDRAGADLVDLIRAHESVCWPDVHGPWLTAAFSGRYDTQRRRPPVWPAPLSATSSRSRGDDVAAVADSAWTIDLDTEEALHPQRLLAYADQLVGGQRVMWGQTWFPDRPGIICEVNGAGRRLALGSTGEASPSARTRLRIVGAGSGREEVARALAEIRLTPRERSACPSSWLETMDELEPFLGPRRKTG